MKENYMKGLYLKSLVLICFVFGFASFSAAQRSNGLAVEGKVSVQEGSVEGAVIQMYEDGRRLDDYGIGSDGHYKVELNYGHKFELIFALEKNFSQKIVVDTKLPREVLASNPSYPPFPVDINLFTEIEGIDKSFSENTVLKIYYSAQVGNFISDLYYNDAQIKKLIEQAILQSQMIGKEEDYLSKLSRAELAELKKEYDHLLKAADDEYGNEKFLDALDGYKAASQIFPKEQYPKDRISEINDLLGIMMVADEMNKALAERFSKLVADADLAFNAQQYFEARSDYNRALSIRPNDSHSNQRVKEIGDILRAQQTEQQYQDLIVRGNNAFNEVLYDEALQIYTEASELRPNETYPKTKIKEINEKLAALAKNTENQKNYEQAIFQGELNYEKQFYDKSIASYENALTYKPGDEKATTRIKEIKGEMNNLANRTMYDKLIASADKAYKKEQLQDALTDYQKALELFPDEAHPSERIASIQQTLNAEANFTAAVQQADQAFNAKEYQNAKNLYSQALAIKADDKHSQDRVKEIDGIMASMQVDEQYNTIIVNADQLLTEKSYDDAKSRYNEALALKSKEQYPKDKIAEIDNILKDIAAVDQKYKLAVEKADNLFAKESYDEAKTVYAEAGTIKPAETYPPEMIQKIDGILAEQARLLAEQEAAEKAHQEALAQEKDEKYQATVDAADQLVKDDELVPAVAKFREALDIKPQEQYPITRIEEIRGMISSRQEMQKAYDELIVKADKEFNGEQFDAAKSTYNSAKAAKSDETYPDEMLAKIDSIVETRARLAEEAAAAEAARLAADQAEKDSLYNAAIAKADGLFNDKEYETSRNEYRSALEVKPDETYSQQKIDEIGNLLAQLSEAQKAYEDAVARGDKEFKREGFDEAKTAYNEAKAAKSDETYPDEMLAKIDSIVEARARLAEEAAAAETARLAAAQAEKDSLYNAAIAKADGLFNDKEYETSRNEYRSALEVKPDETYPQQKIEEIGTLLAQLSEAQKAYEDAVARGDSEFKREGFEEAKTAYNEAKAAKSDETYPDEMLAKIDSIVETRARLAEEAAAAEAARLAAAQAEKDSLYNAAIAKADGLFNDKEYETSRNEYRSALEVKPDETYPQQKIEEIGTLLAQLSEAQKAYEDAVARGDKEFKREGFDEAKTAYNEAKAAKSDETYPDEMLAKIDSIIDTRARLAEEAAAAEAARLAAAQAEKDSLYNAAIAKADGLFNDKEYETSRNEYRSALEIKPDETYPQQKIDEIGTLLAQLSEAQKAYEDAVARGDNEFKREGFDEAKTAYNEAKAAKSDETYPDEMLAKIDSIVEARAILAEEAASAEAARLAAAQAEKDSLYNAAIAKADGLFNDKEYETSRNEYRSALEVKPDETYPQQKIDEIGTLLAQLSEAQNAYEDAVARGDKEFKREGFDEAKTAYNEAKAAKSDETYPDEMLAKIDSIVEARARLAEEAASAEAARLAADQAEKDSLYNAAIAKADGLFNDKEYETSRNEYRSALEVKPDETYPQQKIDEIGTLLAQLSEAQKAYEDAVARGDSEFKREGFEEAKIAFKEAKTAKSDETYPDEMLAKIDSIVEARARLAEEAASAEAARLAAAQAEKDSLYNAAIAKADGLFNDKEYETSRNEYRSALEVKPDETYPQQKIDEIGTLLAQLSEAQKAYEDAVARGDNEFKREGFEEAKIAYKEAKTAKSDETYPDEMLAKIDSIVEARARLAEEAAAAEAARLAAAQAEKDSLYNAAIAKADGLFNNKEYETSRNEYRSALEVKPDETYPQQKIDEIGTLLQEMADAQSAKETLDKNYAEAIKTADNFFKAKTYPQAKENYQKALGFKPQEEYPAQQITEINGILEQQKVDEEYRKIIVAADGYFKTSTYSDAKSEYKKALGVKPDEQYPKEQIRKIEDIQQKEQQRILAEQQAAADLERRRNEIQQQSESEKQQEIAGDAGLDALYNEYIKTADSYFDNKQYNIARGWYYKAWEVKPEETYPPQRIDEINRLVGNLLATQRDRDYQGFIDLADSTFRSNQLAVARGWYNRALSVKPDESYPKTQLNEIQKLIEERLAGQSGEMFKSHVAKAAKAFDDGDYSVARFWYKKALELQPDAQEVKDKLSEIEEALKK